MRDEPIFHNSASRKNKLQSICSRNDESIAKVYTKKSEAVEEKANFSPASTSCVVEQNKYCWIDSYSLESSSASLTHSNSSGCNSTSTVLLGVSVGVFLTPAWTTTTNNVDRSHRHNQHCLDSNSLGTVAYSQCRTSKQNTLRAGVPYQLLIPVEMDSKRWRTCDVEGRRLECDF